MTTVSVPDGVTRKTARELREALGKIIPEHSDQAAFHDRARFAFFELVAALDEKGMPREVALESAMIMAAQFLGESRKQSAGDELRNLADVFDENYATSSPGGFVPRDQCEELFVPDNDREEDLPPMSEADIRQLDDVLQRLFPAPNKETTRVRAARIVVVRMMQVMLDAGLDAGVTMQTVLGSVLQLMSDCMTVPGVANYLRVMAHTLENGQPPPAPTTRH